MPFEGIQLDGTFRSTSFHFVFLSDRVENVQLFNGFLIVASFF